MGSKWLRYEGRGDGPEPDVDALQIAITEKGKSHRCFGLGVVPHGPQPRYSALEGRFHASSSYTGLTWQRAARDCGRPVEVIATQDVLERLAHFSVNMYSDALATGPILPVKPVSLMETRSGALPPALRTTPSNLVLILEKTPVVEPRLLSREPVINLTAVCDFIFPFHR